MRLPCTGEGFPDTTFTLTQGTTTGGNTFSEAFILSDKSTDVEAFFEGENLKPNGAVNSYNNKKIVMRETAASTHAYKHDDFDLYSVEALNANISNGRKYHVLATVGGDDGASSPVAFTEAVGTTFTADTSGTNTYTSGRVAEVLSTTGGTAMTAGKMYKNISGSAITVNAGTATTYSIADDAVFTYNGTDTFTGSEDIIEYKETFSYIQSASLGGSIAKRL